jgi:ABC-type sugar transport system substrate-binding protein
MLPRRTWFKALPLGALLVVLPLSACGGNNSSSSGAASNSSASSTATDSGAKVDLPAKKIGILNISGSDPGAALAQSGAEQAIKMLGWSSVSVDAAGDPAKAAAGITQLLNQKVDAILDIGADPAILGSGLKTAKADNIPVILASGAGTPSDLVTSVVPNDTILAAYASDYLINTLDGKGNVAIMTTDGLPFAANRTKLFEAEVAKYPGIHIVATHQVDYANYQQDLLSATQSLMKAHPEINAILATISPYPSPIAAALKQMGLTGKVKVVSFYSYPSELKLLQSGQLDGVADADLVQNEFVAVDMFAQYFGKHRPLSSADQYSFPLQYQLVTTQNLPADGKIHYPVDPVAYYQMKWDAEFNIG